MVRFNLRSKLEFGEENRREEGVKK